MKDDTPMPEIEKCMESAWRAFHVYKKYSLRERAHFMRTIAAELEKRSELLIATAAAETHLPIERLQSELKRTTFQLTSYADACERGDWLEARVDTADSNRMPAKPDLRKMQVPLGPVVVFGASNFPFAYSTAGGDTACALAAGCPVVVKGHPAHIKTSELAAEAILAAAKACHMPDGIFAHIRGASFEVGKALVMHPHTKAVGFTGSFQGGKQLFDWAHQRKEPIPVFAEMGSINPVFLLPEKMKESAAEVAKQYGASITLNVGQFCTNPGLLIGIDNEDLNIFIKVLSKEISGVLPEPMLHQGICENFYNKRSNALSQSHVELLAVSQTSPKENEGYPTLAATSAEAFINNPILHEEVFGPYSLIVKCRNIAEMMAVARCLEGQLTSTLIATDNDVINNEELVSQIQNLCGRFILNGVPTGVEVCLAMQHGGPFPATTDSRFTSVGADGIKRFTRPVAFQNWPNHLLPDALKDENPLGIWRTVNNTFTRDKIISD
ncbi:aldehyde dehydrogenase (NADP(+)) [Niabella digestorum]|jgi:NAD-dependent aldehyde dehydrogenases|uniref:Aldehyde dehydrogenase (NADP(+)) n=1 Tax=Niabella digestorum TaxID=3117701 RepID=A0ABU7RFL5_9BACT